MVAGYEHSSRPSRCPTPTTSCVGGGHPWRRCDDRDGEREGFSGDGVGPHNIVAVPPDEFICGLLAEDPQGVIAALSAARASLKNPPMTAET